MDPNEPRWLEHLDIITAWGEASAANQTPPPTDEQLWAASRIRHDLNLPAQIDAELLADLREAFNEGRKPTRIDMQAVADAVNACGVPARVLHSSGNTATLYTGEETLDVYGDVRFRPRPGRATSKPQDAESHSPTPTTSGSARTATPGASASPSTPPPRRSRISSSR